MKIIKVLLCALGVAIIAVSWFFLLDTSYDWISSASNWKAIAGGLILLIMAGIALAIVAAAVALVARGVRHLWLG
jgi:hypothetical protein